MDLTPLKSKPAVSVSYLFTTAQHSPNMILLAVQDTGEGVPLQDSSRLFEPFETTKSEGLGNGAFDSQNHYPGPRRRNMGQEQS